MQGNTLEWLEKAANADKLTTELLSRLDRSEDRCSGCGSSRSKNWPEEQAARALEVAQSRVRKAVEIIVSAKALDRES